MKKIILLLVPIPLLIGAGHYRAGNEILDVQGMELRLIFHVPVRIQV